MLSKLKTWQLQILFVGIVSVPAILTFSILLSAPMQRLIAAETQTAAVLAILALVLVSFGFNYFLVSSMHQELGAEPAEINSIASHIQIDNPEFRPDESGGIHGILAGLHGYLQSLKARDQQKQMATRRLQEAIETASVSLMVADENFDIVYVNAAVVSVLSNAEPEIRKRLPDFKANDLVGKNINIFHQNPTHQRQLLSDLTKSFDAVLELGEALLELTARAIRNPDGSLLGYAVEWRDVTLERKAEADLQGIVSAAKQGNLHYRLSPDGKQGFHLTLTDGLNEFIDAVDKVFEDIGVVMKTMSRGDTSGRMGKKYTGRFDELAVATNSTMEKLSQISEQLLASMGVVGSSTREIVVGNNQLSARTEQQSTHIDETASSIEQLSETVSKTADKARQANGIASQALSVAQQGGEAINRAVAAMTDINKASQKIAEIIGVIDDIAFQTNLLALNASVEAARAGDQGKGFAVVASEVRNLARRSAHSAKEIKDLIEDGVLKVHTGSTLVNESGRTLESIIASVKQVADLISGVAAVTEQQSIGLQEASRAVSDVDFMTQQNAVLVEQTASAAALSMASVGRMMQVMAFFSTETGDIKDKAP